MTRNTPTHKLMI